jgi:hypothetical protein
MQLELFPFDEISQDELNNIHSFIRNSYYHLRNLRSGAFGQARRRKHYRLVAVQKKRLLLAGISKRDILDFLACCREQCSSHKQPFHPCKYCAWWIK